jgi:hypothetical protein
MGGTFIERIRELEDQVGEGLLTGRVSYGPEKIAVPQHEGTWMSGPNAGAIIRHWTTGGTGPKYLEGPLLASHPAYLQALASRALDVGGLVSAMSLSMEALQGESGRRIPREFGDLLRSAKVQVFDNGAQVYGREG